MKKEGKFLYHALAFMTMALWGVTFVSTKTLINQGLSPAQIFTIRFVIAYTGLFTACIIRGGENRRLFSRSLRHELLFLLMGIAGGSLYFLTENTALKYTQACNVSFIVCVAPLLTILLTLVLKHTVKSRIISELEDVKVRFPLIAGTVLALSGMVMVIFDGTSLNLSPKGDLLAFTAALSWAFYSQFMGQMTNRYGTLFATRKVFFYGLLTILPYYLVFPGFPSMEVLFSRQVIWNLLFLSVVASMVCFLVWNWVIRQLGAVVATNWVYFNPITTILFAWWLLHEHITVWFLLGSILIIVGMILSERKGK